MIRSRTRERHANLDFKLDLRSQKPDRRDALKG